MRKLRGCIGTILFLIVALAGFVLIFPYFHNIENMNGQMAARNSGGAFLRLDNGINIHYLEKGSGDNNIILLHGFGSSTYTWKQTIPALSKFMHVYAPDMMGFGFSDKPLDGTYTYDNFADIVLQFMDKKGIKKATIAGSSMGGGITLAFAAKYPERVERVILVDSAGYPHKNGGPLKLLGAPVLGPFIFSLNNPNAMGLVLKQTSFYDDTQVTDVRKQAYFQPFRVHGAARAASKTVKAIAGTSLQDKIKKIDKPTLIVWGKEDALIPFDNARRFQRDIKDSELVPFHNAATCPRRKSPRPSTAMWCGISSAAPTNRHPKSTLKNKNKRVY
jgi:pimeloyl-ACP methyl ester carboxylesterase